MAGVRLTFRHTQLPLEMGKKEWCTGHQSWLISLGMFSCSEVREKSSSIQTNPKDFYPSGHTVSALQATCESSSLSSLSLLLTSSVPSPKPGPVCQIKQQISLRKTYLRDIREKSPVNMKFWAHVNHDYTPILQIAIQHYELHSNFDFFPILPSLSPIYLLICSLSLHVINLLNPLGFCLNGCLLIWSKCHLPTISLDLLLTWPWIPQACGLPQLSAGQGPSPVGPLHCSLLSLGGLYHT